MKRKLIFDDIPLDTISRNKIFEKIVDWTKKKLKKRIFYINVHSIALAKKDSLFLYTLNKGDIVYPDGWGPILATSGQQERVNAADFVDELFLHLNKKGIRIYLLGDTALTLKKAIKVIIKKYKNIEVVGYHNGFFNEVENKSIIKEINIKKPQLTMIAMSSPMQERWIVENWENLPNSVFWSVGGLFNYIAGNRKRAPSWMQKYSLEWLYRFIQEPRRLFFRYSVENVFFVLLFIKYSFVKLFQERRV